MDSIKAPAHLSRRNVKQSILDQRDDAIEFGEKIKEEVLAFLRRSTVEDLHPYIDAAAARIAIRYGFSNEVSFRHSQRDDMPQWLHVWSFRGTARSHWSDTNMVIRKDGTLNVEHLSERILANAHDDLQSVENAIKRAAVAEAIGEYVAPKGYRVSPEARGVTVSYLEAYGGSLSLSRTVDASKVAELIIAHQRWVEAYRAIS